MEARISFRAGAPIAEALALRASKAGCSVSEYLRSIVRDHVGLSAPPPPINIAADKPLSVHEAAARGDGASFLEIAGWHYQQGLDGELPAIVAFARAADCTRFATCARGDRQDWLNHLFLLDCYANALRDAGFGKQADKVLAESVALAEFMAEDGDEEVGNMVAASADHLSPETLTLARDLREHVKATLQC